MPFQSVEEVLQAIHGVEKTFTVDPIEEAIEPVDPAEMTRRLPFLHEATDPRARAEMLEEMLTAVLAENRRLEARVRELEEEKK